jgi:hypothetical protein
MSELNYINSKKNIILYLVLIITFGLGLRFYYFPYDVPIVTDGFFSFVYAMKTVFDSSLPIGYTTTNSGWSNFLSLFFIFSDTSDPLHLMDIQRTLSIILSTITVIPAFFIFRRFVGVRWALFGSFLLSVEPWLLLISLEGINYSLYFFLFVLTISLFLKKTNVSLLLSFACIACATLVRYEGLLLLIPLSIMYFLKFKDKKSIIRFLGMIFIFMIILMPTAALRIQATENICYESFFGVICGEDGIFEKVLSGPYFIEKYFISESPVLGDPAHEKIDKPMFDHFIFISINNFVKFLGYSTLPFFAFFILFSLGLIIKNRTFWKFDWDKKMILLTAGIMLLPAIYAYGRGIEEVRYVLVAIPLICILSIYWTNIISEKISRDKKIIVILVILVLISSVIFIEFNKRDSVLDRESYLISEKIIEITDVTNTFNKNGYIKTAVLTSNWPDLLEPDESGKLIHMFHKILSEDFDDMEHLITESRKDGLQYIVIDENTRLFADFRKNPSEYPYLDKVFDSDDYDFINHFRIYKINYTIFDKSD